MNTYPLSSPYVSLAAREAAIDRVFELRDFVQNHGRFPREIAPNGSDERSLAKWLAKQRTGTNTGVYGQLDKYVPGWRLAGRDGAWRIALSQVEGFINKHGRRPNKNAECGSAEAKLIAWVKNQQTALRAKRAGTSIGRKITDEQEALLVKHLPTIFSTPA